MKRRCFFAAAIVGVVMLSSISPAATYGGGSGTSIDPWLISTAEQMNTIGLNPADWAGCFKLTANIDMGTYTGTQYNIIGNATTLFNGTFDGSRHVIRNLTYTTTATQNYVGLFGTLSGTVQNLGLEDVYLTSAGDCIGGLAGYNEIGTVTACYAGGTVSGNDYVGGLLGVNDYGTVTACYAADTVGGNDYVGGLVGCNDYGTVTACYAAGAVGGNDYVGGLVGGNTGTLRTCYSTGPVSGLNSVGGLVGYCGDISAFNYCCWDVQTSGQTSSCFGEGESTSTMKLISIFISSGWDFINETANGTNNYWRMCADSVDYPRLSWESGQGDMACPDGVAIDDFSALAAQWQRSICNANSNFCGLADMDFSGSVDTADLLIFAGDWLE